MVEAQETKVPGISFMMTAHTERGLDHDRVQVTATLKGEYHSKDEELWKKVYTKMMDGFRIFSENDFQAEVLQVMRQEYELECQKHEGTKRALSMQTAELERVQRKLAALEATLGQLGSTLRGR